MAITIIGEAYVCSGVAYMNVIRGVGSFPESQATAQRRTLITEGRTPNAGHGLRPT